jgi:hypothetical protein
MTGSGASLLILSSHAGAIRLIRHPSHFCSRHFSKGFLEETMRTALYFPHTEIKTESLLKKSLLLWDYLEYIVPESGYSPHYSKKEMAEAVELIGKPLVPNRYEKLKTHSMVEDFATGTLPDPFFYKDTGGYADRDYLIYPQKFLGETWSMLQALQLAGKNLINDDYPLARPAGLSVMSILADCCAGETRARVTDQALAYATIANLTNNNAERTDVMDGMKFSAYESTVSMTLGLLEMSSLPLANLIRFREREASERGGYSLTTLRHNYLTKIEDHVKELSKGLNIRDLKELERNFDSDMKSDLKHLTEELWRAKVDVVLSKESFAVLATVTVGIAASHILPFAVPGVVLMTGMPVTVGAGALSSVNKYAMNRKSILDKHPMAYLYELERHRR